MIWIFWFQMKIAWILPLMSGIKDRTLLHLQMFSECKLGSVTWTSPSMFLSLLLVIPVSSSAILDQVLDLSQLTSLKALEQTFNLRQSVLHLNLEGKNLKQEIEITRSKTYRCDSGWLQCTIHSLLSNLPSDWPPNITVEMNFNQKFDTRNTLYMYLWLP